MSLASVSPHLVIRPLAALCSRPRSPLSYSWRSRELGITIAVHPPAGREKLRFPKRAVSPARETTLRLSRSSIKPCSLPRDPALNRIRRETWYTVPIRTTPAGASVYVKPYGKPGDPWLYLGQSPLENLLLPVGYFRWRITKPGFRTVESAAGIQGPITEFILDREDSVSPEMVHVPPGISGPSAWNRSI